MEISELRSRIDDVDGRMLALFPERMDLSEQIALYKRDRALPIENAAREREILQAVSEKAGGRAAYARRLFEELFALSKARQRELYNPDAGGARRDHRDRRRRGQGRRKLPAASP